MRVSTRVEQTRATMALIRKKDMYDARYAGERKQSAVQGLAAAWWRGQHRSVARSMEIGVVP